MEVDGKGVPRHNVRPCVVLASKLVWAKNIQNLGFLFFTCYDLMSCEVFTLLAVNNNLDFFKLF